MIFEVTGDEMAPMNPDGSAPEGQRPWAEGALIEVTKDGPCTGYVLVGNGKNEDDDIPLNSCAMPRGLRVVEGGKS